MKANNVNLSFACNEQWHLMEERQHGRFCGKCEKVVEDLTESTNEQLYDRYLKNNGKLCGQFTKRQVEFVAGTHIGSRKYVRVLRRFLVAAIIAFGATLFSINSTYAQDVIRDAQGQFNSMVDLKKENQYVIYGVVTNDTGEPLEGVSITYNKGEEWLVDTTNALGEYAIHIPKERVGEGENVKMYFHKAGHNYRYVYSGTADLELKENIRNDVELQEHVRMMRGVMIAR